MALNSGALGGIALGTKALGSGSIATGPVDALAGSLIVIEQTVEVFNIVAAGGPLVTAEQSIEINALAGSLVSVEQSVQITATGGQLIDVSQTVGIYASGSLVGIEQTILQQIQASGSLITVEQSTITTGIGSLITIEQRIKDSSPTVLTNEDKFGWDLLVTIDGVVTPNDEIHGDLNITRRESNAALLDITLQKSTGVQDLYYYHGKSITVDLIEPNKIGRIYTGIIDIPEVDLINGLITLRCTDKRKEQINSQFALSVQSIGKWSSYIFDTPVDTFDELTQRLKTTTTAVDFDAYGNYTVASTMPKPLADITVNNSDVFYRKPSIQVASRARLTNRVNVEFTFQYIRLRHRELDFILKSPSFCQIITSNGLYKFIRVSSVPSTISSTSFKEKPNSLAFIYMPDSGAYTCRSIYTGAFREYFWSTAQTAYQTQPVLDSSGNQVFDSSGNPIYETVRTSVTDFAKAFALEASWTGAKDFAQDIQEKISIEVNAPQSQARLGVIEADQKNGHRIEYDATEFEKNEAFTYPSGATLGSDTYRDVAGETVEYITAIDTALSMAMATIKNSHRANIATFETPVRSDIDLKHTVAINTDYLSVTGKVVDIKHRFNMSTRAASSAISLAFSQSDNSPPSDSLSIPLLTAPLVGNTSTDPLIMYSDEAANPSYGTFRTPTADTANHSFDVPAIDDVSRDEQLIEANYAYDIPIQNDALTVTFK